MASLLFLEGVRLMPDLGTCVSGFHSPEDDIPMAGSLTRREEMFSGHPVEDATIATLLATNMCTLYSPYLFFTLALTFLKCSLRFYRFC